MKNLKNLNVVELNAQEVKITNGGNGVHAIGNSNIDMKPVGDFFVGVAVGLYNKLFK